MNNDPKPPIQPTEPAAAKPTGFGWFNSPPRLLLGLAVVLLAALLIYALAANRQTSKVSSGQPAVQSAQASLTAKGFVPATIQLKAGTQLTWTNQDTDPHQVAADPYPKNDSIPGFDSTQTLLTNSSYSFRFSSPGTYHLHDQLHPLEFHETVVVK